MSSISFVVPVLPGKEPKAEQIHDTNF